MKDSQKGNTNQKNYVFHEIKDIKGKPKIPPENFEIIEDLTEIHEIKELKRKNPKNINNNIHHNFQQYMGTPENYQGDLYINLEGEPEHNIYQFNSDYYEKREDAKNFANEEEMNINKVCNEFHHNEISNQNINNEEQKPKNYGFVDAPFLFGEKKLNTSDNNEIVKEDNDLKFNENNEEENLYEEKISNLIEKIFEQLKREENLNNNSNLKISFKELNENEKNEIIEGVKIKIENKEQEERLNNLLEILY